MQFDQTPPSAAAPPGQQFTAVVQCNYTTPQVVVVVDRSITYFILLPAFNAIGSLSKIKLNYHHNVDLDAGRQLP